MVRTRRESNPAPAKTRSERTATIPPPLMSATDRTLMLLPYEKWISIGTAAQRAKIDKDAAISIVRLGRRRGVLRTRGKGAGQQIMRVYPGPRRPIRRSMGSQK